MLEYNRYLLGLDMDGSKQREERKKKVYNPESYSILKKKIYFLNFRSKS